jgi:hypothetical protein
MKTVSESIFSGKRVVIPMADVQHIEKKYWDTDLVNGTKKGDLMGILVITKHTRWDMDADTWANNIWLGKDEAESFMSAWCNYRHELEIETLADHH